MQLSLAGHPFSIILERIIRSMTPKAKTVALACSQRSSQKHSHHDQKVYAASRAPIPPIFIQSSWHPNGAILPAM